MTIRNKLLILLLSVSLLPLAAYFIIDISAKGIVRDRIHGTLQSALEERAQFELIQTIDNYGEKLKLSAQAVRYGLRHYADQVQQVLWHVNIKTEQPSTSNYLIRTSPEEISKEAYKYQFKDSQNNQKLDVDFNTQYICPKDSESHNLLRSQLSQLTATCRDIYSINPDSKIWIYTVIEDGTVALYPSPAFWPYDAGYDIRREPWYIKTKTNKQLTPTQRIEPVTGKTVMTVAMPLFKKDASLAGVIAVDIDLSNLLDRIKIPQQWQQGAWKLLIKPPEPNQGGVDDVKIVCMTSFTKSRKLQDKSHNLLDYSDPETIKQIIEDSQREKTDIIRKPYNDVDSFWAYGPSKRGGGFPVVIVPYQRIMEQANNAQQTLFRDNIRAIQVATILSFLVIVTAVVLAIMRARNVTVPITHLADAAGKLAQGDFDVKVEINTNDEIQDLGRVFNQVGSGLKERQKIKHSLELAQQIQQHFLPAENLQMNNFQVAGVCRYCDETGGDYYDFLDLTTVAPGLVGLVLGDISGHGLPAAMLMISAGSILRNNAPSHGEKLSAAISELNRHLVRNSETGKFMTLFYGLLNDKRKSLLWASAGHDPAIWYDAQSTELIELENTGMPLGLVDDAKFDQTGPVTLKSGDIILIGTDGIWEAQNDSGEMYGKQRLFDLIKTKKDESAQAMSSSVVESVLDFCAGTDRTDDITLIVIKCIC